MRKGQPELLAPAGSYEGVKAAAAAGADAVYTGGTKFSARAFARNLSEEQLLQAIDELHLAGEKAVSDAEYPAEKSGDGRGCGLYRSPV